MYYVRWPSAKRIHLVSLTKSGGGIHFDPVTRKCTSESGRLTTMCGEAIPEEHQGIERLTADEHNNELCNTCLRTKAPW